MRKRATLLLITILAFQSILQTSATPTWNIQVVDSYVNGGVGYGSSLVLDSNGNPHISYVDWQQRLRYAAWSIWGWKIQTVYSDAASQYTSLALDSKGNPHIMFSKSERASDLMYASWTGSNWDIQAVNVDSADTLNRFSSLVLDSNDNPHISYTDLTSEKLKYASNTGSGWKTQTIDSGTAHASLALDANGKPHVVYQNASVYYTSKGRPVWQSFFKYAQWMGDEWEIQIVGQFYGTPVGFCPSLALDSKGNPYISYFDDVGSLGYAHWDGHNWSFIQITLPLAEHEFDYGNAMTSIRLDSSDTPRIIYYDGSENLSYASSNGSFWSTQIIEQIRGTTEVHASLALDSEGNPHISYCDNDLKYAVFASSIQSQYSFYFVVSFIVAALVLSILLFRKWKKRRLSAGMFVHFRFSYSGSMMKCF